MVTKKQILARLDELTELIKSEQFKQLQKDSEELKKLQSLLIPIKFKIKDVNYFEDEENGVVQIRYELPTINLKIDDAGNPEKNEFFYSVNVLDMVSLEDMQKVQKLLERIKK